tara:strand:+ start:1660 stop:2205 length:546 start_codon:yes stop_codon:yes gene_type:complete
MSVKIKIENEKELPPSPSVSTINLEVRKTLDGKIMILDHLHIDILLDTGTKQITVFPKDVMTDEVYGFQNQYLEFLVKEGVIAPESIQGGNVFGSLQASYPESADESVNPTQIVMLSTKKFLDERSPEMESADFIENNIEDNLVEPPEDETTPLGQVPQEPQKGTITPARIRKYLSGYGYY